MEGGAGSYPTGSQSLIITITMDDSASTVVNAPNPITITMEVVDCTPSYNWLVQKG